MAGGSSFRRDGIDKEVVRLRKTRRLIFEQQIYSTEGKVFTMKRKIVLSSMLVLLVALAAVPAFARGGGPRGRPVVYAKSQGLFYDSIVTAMNLPANGPFQLFEMGGPSGFQTEFGPGDTGYVGGRWWVDLNDNGEQDDTDMYFSCPLLGPGRTSP